jgi:hypothetical protein
MLTSAPRQRHVSKRQCHVIKKKLAWKLFLLDFKAFSERSLLASNKMLAWSFFWLVRFLITRINLQFLRQWTTFEKNEKYPTILLTILYNFHYYHLYQLSTHQNYLKSQALFWRSLPSWRVTLLLKVTLTLGK